MKRKKLILLNFFIFSMSIAASTITVQAAPSQSYNSINMELSMNENPISPTGLLTTKYRVTVNKATMRSGPGTNYSALGILYKNDVVWVRSISNGWAKFKVNGQWRYIPEKCIKKATY